MAEQTVFDNPVDFLKALGTDASQWADAYAHVTQGSDRADALDPTPGGMLHAWFANAIEAGRSAGYVDACMNPEAAEIVRNALTPDSSKPTFEARIAGEVRDVLGDAAGQRVAAALLADDEQGASS